MRWVLMLFLCVVVISCGPAVGDGTADEANMFVPMPDAAVQWRKLADGSFGYLDQNKSTVTAERCWRADDRFQCINLSRSIDKSVFASSHFRDELRAERVYAQHGYRCQLESGYGAIESVFLDSGAEIKNTVSTRMPGAGLFWTFEFVQNLVAQNGPTTPVIYFRCAALRDLLDRANEAALLTTTISAADLDLR